MPLIAKLAIQSSLPQLDRLFDYQIPEDLAEQVLVGSRVRVNFGRSKKPLDAFVVELGSETDFSGRLSEVLSVIGPSRTLSKTVFMLCQQLAERSAASLGEVLKLAVPSHMPKAFTAHSKNQIVPAKAEPGDTGAPDQGLEQLNLPGEKSFVLAEPRVVAVEDSDATDSTPAWVVMFVAIAKANFALNKSSIVLVPDYREHEVLMKALIHNGLAGYVADYSQDQPKSKQYEAFLQAVSEAPRIIVGSRSAAFAPAHNLGSILVFDEADQSYSDKAAPYLLTRDVVLVRQSIEKCSLVFSSHSMSCDMKRLIEAGFLVDRSKPFAAPRVSNSDPGLRVDSHAYGAIKAGLEIGPVLVQVSSLGDSTAMYCKSCDEPARCGVCQGPVWVDSSGSKKCRWCNSFQLDHICNCGGSVLTLGRAGATRTAAELGRAFPSAKVVESTGQARMVTITRGRTLVVATPGAEPYVPGGYAAVVLLDAKVALSRQNLRAQEEAVRTWSNAIAKAAPKSPAVLVGVSGELSQLFSLWNHDKIAEIEYRARQELQLPPAIRMGSITAERVLLNEISNFLAGDPAVVRIGPAPLEVTSSGQLWRLIIKYPYGSGLNLAKLLKAEVSRVSAGKSRTSSTGRSARAITVKMNDSEVV